MPRNKANDGLGEMNVEVVANDIPACLAAALLSKVSRKRAKSSSVRVSPITPTTSPIVTSKPAIRVCVPWIDP